MPRQNRVCKYGNLCATNAACSDILYSKKHLSVNHSLWTCHYALFHKRLWTAITHYVLIGKVEGYLTKNDKGTEFNCGICRIEVSL